MFEDFDRFYIQRNTNLIRGLAYSFISDNKVIGTIRERDKSKTLGNKIIKFLRSFLLNDSGIIEKLDLELADMKGNRLGIIKKDIGFKTDFNLYDENEEYIASIKLKPKLNSPVITAVKENNEPFLKAAGGYGATDFSVSDSKTEEEISTINKRSISYEKVRDNLYYNDVYHIKNEKLSSEETFIVIAMVISADLYYHFPNA